MIDHVHALPEGYRLQEYTITGLLGFGGFGITYAARDNNLNKIVAIKEYLPSDLAVRGDGSTISAKSEQDKDSFDWGLERFLDEARTVALFDHPNIVRIHRFFEQNGTGYIVMEYIDGRTLDSVLKKQGTLEESEIRLWLWPVIEGLKIVHKHGFLHRDIKPQNIMMRENGRPCLLDFGAARLAMGGRTCSLTSIMTPGFAPLEQYQTKGQGPWTDIYGLAAVMYKCIAGEKPQDALDRVTDDSLVSPEANSDKTYTPHLLEGIVAALAVAAKDRPQTLETWLEVLDATAELATLAMPRKPVPPGPMANPEANPETNPETNPIVEAGPIQAAIDSIQTVLKGRKEWVWVSIAALVLAIGLYAFQSDEQVQVPISIEKSVSPGESIDRPAVSGPDAAAIAPGPGSISISSNAPNSRVYLDGTRKGHAPLIIDKLEAGKTVLVIVEAPGYQSELRYVKVQSRQRIEVNFDLQGKGSAKNKRALTIQPIPPDAQVRVLNIGPLYQPGMVLAPGKYHIEVSKPGYVTKSQWVEIADQNLNLMVVLEKD